MTLTPAHDDAHDEWAAIDGPAGEPTVRALLYSDHAQTREAVRLAAGRRVARDLPPIEWTEVATHAAAEELVHSQPFDLLVLDGETGKTGGMGLARQLKDEVFRCPPVLLLLARSHDAWLASWSGADAMVALPVDPLELQDAVAALLRDRVAAG